MGNYYGVISPILEFQDAIRKQNNAIHDSPSPTMFFEIANLHSLTTSKPDTVKRMVYESFAMLLASGLDPAMVTIFRQSDVPEHAALMWMLLCKTSLCQLSSMIQWKEKASAFGENCGLLTYPVLQAADILLYATDLVIVGPDQVQHLELTSKLVQKINSTYPRANIVRPEARVSRVRIMDLRNPLSKMSKSSLSKDGCIFLDDSAETIRLKFMRAVTGCNETIVFDKDRFPGISSLIEIFSAIENTTPCNIVSRYSSLRNDFSAFKTDLSDAIIAKIQPIKAIYNDLLQNRDYLEKTLLHGGEKARLVATVNYKKLLDVFT